MYTVPSLCRSLKISRNIYLDQLRKPYRNKKNQKFNFQLTLPFLKKFDTFHFLFFSKTIDHIWGIFKNQIFFPFGGPKIRPQTSLNTTSH